MEICNQCGREFKDTRGLKIHILHMHTDTYTIAHEKCKNSFKGKKHSKETKAKMSESRKKFISENKNNHNWSLYRNCETKPEKLFKDMLEKVNNEVIYQYYIPKKSERCFEIDFAIPNKKIGFEINGNQHYDNNGNLLDYYQNRHNYLVGLGWNIIEIHYSICFNEELIKNIIIETLNDNILFSQNICNTILNDKILRKQQKLEIIKKNKENKQLKKQEFINNKINLIINSNIDFSKRGWVKETANLINVPEQKVTRWMRSYMFNFWNQNCFKRKGTKKSN